MVVVVVVVVVVAFSSLVRILGECSTINSLTVIFFFFSGDYLTHTNSTLYARIGQRWLSELRRLWPNVLLRAAYELVS